MCVRLRRLFTLPLRILLFFTFLLFGQGSGGPTRRSVAMKVGITVANGRCNFVLHPRRRWLQVAERESDGRQFLMVTLRIVVLIPPHPKGEGRRITRMNMRVNHWSGVAPPLQMAGAAL